jgi:DNA-binding MarR family transcriptional regulator
MAIRTSTFSEPDYKSLAELRYQIRRFVRFSEDISRAGGLEPHQYQLLLAVKGLPVGTRPIISELAERLQIKHHSTVELINRLAERGLMERRPSAEDRREVLLTITAAGEEILRKLAWHHENELWHRGPELIRAMQRLMRRNLTDGSSHPISRPKRTIAKQAIQKAKSKV